MRFCSIRLDGREQAAIDTAAGIVPVGWLNQRAGARFPTTLRSIISERAAEGIARCVRYLKEPPEGIPATQVEFAPPYRNPPKLWGIGLNYRAHADDLQAVHPTEEPASFMKPTTTIIGPGDTILLPPQSRRVTAEAEIAVIIGRECRNVPLADVPSVIFGYTTVLDMTAEDILQKNPRFLTRAKSFNTFFSFGPWVVTAEEIRDLAAVRVATIHNGRVRAESVVANMQFQPHWLVHFHSQVMTLQPGDIISTGTPGAVPFEDADLAEAEVEGIGRLANPVKRPV